MIISKVLNNNCVVSRDENDKEVILMGSGLAFGLKKGDFLDRKRVQKVFRLEHSVLSKFQNVVKDIPAQYILAADKVIAYIKAKTEAEISDSIYITLTDHIWASSERIKKGIKFDNVLLINVRGLYRKEYEVALIVTKMLKDYLKLDFDESETDFITLHIINAQMESEMTHIHKITKIVSDISEYVIELLQINPNADRISFDRFLVHCRFLIQKVVTGKEHEPKTEEPISKFIKRFMFKEYPESESLRGCVDGIARIIKNECHYLINEDERLFLYIHVARLEMREKRSDYA
ncbi:MAG: PRD domain-containing protein [Streptococcaceae bacterium]|jgi:beta-glucoside operon transcriptional antiterminator|nr:PRD domain-containing protein [Streptococcaceae bacterium]